MSDIQPVQGYVHLFFSDAYTWVITFLVVTFKKFGIGINWVTEISPEAFAKAIDEKTKAIFVETIGNPKFVMFDLPALAKV